MTLYGVNIYADTKDIGKFNLVNDFLEYKCAYKRPSDKELREEIELKYPRMTFMEMFRRDVLRIK